MCVSEDHRQILRLVCLYRHMTQFAVFDRLKATPSLHHRGGRWEASRACYCRSENASTFCCYFELLFWFDGADFEFKFLLRFLFCGYRQNRHKILFAVLHWLRAKPSVHSQGRQAGSPNCMLLQKWNASIILVLVLLFCVFLFFVLSVLV